MKRKRTEEEEFEKLLASLHHEIHHALKQAKGYERQRQSKRLRDSKTAQEKKQRIQNEIVVLKSLDLQQTAHAHMCSALLRFKVIAESPKLPPEIKAGVVKPDLTEDEKTALHNVTSTLFARPEVRAATEKTIAEVCKAFGVEVPKKTKGKAPEAKDDQDGSKKDAKPAKGAEEGDVTKKQPKPEKESDKRKPTTTTTVTNEDSEEDVDEVADKEEQALARLDALLGSSDDEEEVGEDEISLAKLKLQATKMVSLGKDLDPMEITSGEEDEEGDEYDMELDPMGISSDEDGGGNSDSDEESDSESESGSFEGFSDSDPKKTGPSLSNSVSASDSDSDSDSESSAALSPPRKKKPTAKSTPFSAPGGSTFLPSLMGGYISDSNSSASDLDLMPTSMSRKNRRGQRARQAIWEKKYKEQAKHLVEGGNNANARDAGWDLKRGAVDAAAGKPWKQGIKNPLTEKKGEGEAEPAAEGFAEGGDRGGRTLLNHRDILPARGGKGKGKAAANQPLNRKERRAAGIRTPVGPPGGGFNVGGGGAGKPPPPGKKRDDEGVLHPSWEAKKKAKEMLETAPYAGKKITFD